jgi:hypothetical protein
MDEQRRTILGASAAVGAALIAGTAKAQTSTPPAPAAPANGQPGDFDFLSGEWRIHHRYREANGTWIEFDGEATVHPIIGGVGSVEDLRIPVRDFNGMGLRLLDLETRVWSDYWVNKKSGVLGGAGLTGNFINGVGDFRSEEGEGAERVISRGVWDTITPTSCRWRQGVSRDGGATWDEGWFMDWRRA